MSHTYNASASTATPGSPFSLLVPDDGDADTAASVNTPFQKLADMLEFTRQGAVGWYGNGSDGALAFNGIGAVTGFTGPVASVYTATRDIFASSAVISSAVTVQMAGFRFYCAGLLDMSAANAAIAADGGAASGATGGTGATGGVLATAAAMNGAAGVVGPNNGNGVALTSSLSALFNSGTVTGGGASGGGQPGGQGTAAAPAVTAGDVRVPSVLATGLLVGAGGVISPNGGAGGGSGGAAAGGTSGGGGGGGGVLIVCALVLNLSGTAVIGARGGAGGNATAGNAGGGGGGQGGFVGLTYRSLATGSQDPVVNGRIIVTPGTGGTKTGTGLNGVNGFGGGFYVQRA